MKKINSIQELKDECNPAFEGFIWLGGPLKSSKTITLENPYEFNVFHDIDGTSIVLSEDELLKTNIGESISKGTFYMY